MSTLALAGPVPAYPAARHRARAVARILLLDVVNVVLLPWIVLVAALLVNVAIWALVPEAAAGGTGGVLSMYGYSMAMVAALVGRSFPYLLGSGVTRRSFCTGAGLMLAGYVVVTALVLTGLWLLEDATDGWGLGGRFFRVPWITDVQVWQLPAIYGLPMLFLLAVMALYAAVWLRWRAVGAVSLSMALAVVLVGGLWLMGQIGWSRVGAWFSETGPLGLMGLLGAVGVVAAAGAWLSLRRAPA